VLDWQGTVPPAHCATAKVDSHSYPSKPCISLLERAFRVAPASGKRHGDKLVRPAGLRCAVRQLSILFATAAMTAAGCCGYTSAGTTWVDDGHLASGQLMMLGQTRICDSAVLARECMHVRAASV
jgi:hypothetical protein